MTDAERALLLAIADVLEELMHSPALEPVTADDERRLMLLKTALRDARDGLER